VLQPDVLGLIILVICIILFIGKWIPAAATGVLGCLLMVLTKVCTFEEAFGGFSSSIVILLASAMVVGIALFKTGAAQLIGRFIITATKNNEFLFLVVSCLVCGVLAMFLANTAILAAFIPIVDCVCEISPSMKRRNLLLPIAYSVMVGEACTLIGCTPQLTANALLLKLTGEQMTMCSLTGPGVCILALYLLYNAFFGYKDGKKIWGKRPEADMGVSQEKKDSVMKTKADKKKLIIVSIIVVLMLISYATSFISTTLTAVIAVMLCILTGCCSVKDCVRELPWETMVFLASCLGLANGLSAAGSGDLIGKGVSFLLGSVHSPFVIYAVMTVFTLILSQFITNSTAIIIVLPIAVSMCTNFGFNVMPFCLGITLAASIASCTPLAAAQITMTQVAGYEFSDYLRYGWKPTLIMLLCGFMTMFICYVIKVNCSSLFYNPICEEFGISRTAYIQTNTALTACMMIGSLFIGKIYKKFPMKFVLAGCVAVTCICYLLMSRATALWQLIVLSAIQGFAWAGATNLPANIMVSNWFGPKVKGTALSIAMLGSGAGALVWIRVINSVIAKSGWRMGYVAMAGVNAIVIVIALVLVVSMPSDKGFEKRIGDPDGADEEENGKKVSLQNAGITGQQALKTARWWLQFLGGMLTMVGAAAFSAQFVPYFTEVTGDATKAASLYSSALGTMILGKFLVGVLSDVLHIKRTSVIFPLFYGVVFICMALASKNMTFATVLIPFYMFGGAVPSTIPFLLTARNFGDKEYGVMAGWMNLAGNIGQILGPTIAAFIFDKTGAYTTAWIIFAILMAVVSVLYLLSGLVSRKQIEKMGYKPV